jgi:hypothetical protein
MIEYRIVFEQERRNRKNELVWVELDHILPPDVDPEPILRMYEKPSDAIRNARCEQRRVGDWNLRKFDSPPCGFCGNNPCVCER